MENINSLDVLQGSKCETCCFRMSRVVEPTTQEDIEYYLDLLNIEVTDGYELFIEQHKCLITNEEIDGIIHVCTQYQPSTEIKLIREYKF